MWHEARKQEKLIRSKLVDSAKRHERRQAFYAQIRKDPEQFMQIHGRKAKIHIDPAVANAAEASNILRKWQGDPTVLIDRFDARAHLDYIPEPSVKPEREKTLKEDVEELQCDYERYRILVLNEYQKIAEKDFLKQIAANEFWQAASSHTHKAELEKKKKAAQKKAAIGFSYDGSETVPGQSKFQKKGDSSESESEEEIDEPEEVIEVRFDVDSLSAEKGAELNRVATQYQIGSGTFLKLLRIDRKEQDDSAQIKEIDKAKLALSGRQAKGERALLKKRRAMIVGKVAHNEDATTTLLSFLAHTKGDLDEHSSSSSGDSDAEVEKTEFITSFGDDPTKANRKHSDDDNDADAMRVVQGPILPTKEYRRLLELKHRRSSRSHLVAQVTFAQQRPTWTLERPTPIAIKKPFEKPIPAGHLTNSHTCASRSKPKQEPKSGEAYASQVHVQQGVEPFAETCAQASKQVKVSGYCLASSVIKIPKCKHTLLAPRFCLLKAKRHRIQRSSSGKSASDSPLTIRSSMSESEKERIEIENRKRRIRRTKRDLKHRRKRSPSSSDEDAGKKSSVAKKLRLQVQKAIKKTAQEQKAEEEEKAREQQRERMKRDEEDARRFRRSSRDRERSYDELEKRRSRRRRSSSSSD
ncbi:splicing factor [Aphelenchoides avenae]|nr:splicing factor [Aphelenchus avenae]